MRRFFQLCGVLLLAVAIYAISGIADPSTVKPPERRPVTPVVTPDPNIREDEPDHSIIEYGTSQIIKDNNGPLFTFIRFPQAGNSTDDVISEWAYRFYNERVIEFQSVLEDEPGALGEINVHFDSYLVDNKYAGIYESGEYTYSFNLPTNYILKTFNIDLTTNRFLENTEILNFSHTSEVIAPLLFNRLLAEHPRTEGSLAFIDETWLSNLVIGSDGIIVIIEKNTLIPNYDTIAVTLPYNDLGPTLLIRTEFPLASTPLPDRTPEPDRLPGGLGLPDDEPVPPQSGTIVIRPTDTVIALSFDDGPGIYTNDFLDLLEEYNVRATFCVIGNLVNTQKEALKRAVDIGCEVVGHSWDHKNLAKLPPDAVRKQLTDTRDIIQSVTGKSTPLFRPPYGESNETMKEIAAELGLSLINWNVDPEDWNTKDSEEVYNAVMMQVKDGAIILSHEIYKSTLDAYRRLIPDLLHMGYKIVTVTELLTLREGEIEPGKVYYNG